MVLLIICSVCDSENILVTDVRYDEEKTTIISIDELKEMYSDRFKKQLKTISRIRIKCVDCNYEKEFDL